MKTQKHETTGTPLASETVNVSTLDSRGTWKTTPSPEPKAPIRFEMMVRTNSADYPLKDDEGFNVVYAGTPEGLELAESHLAALPLVDDEAPLSARTVYFIRAITQVDENDRPIRGGAFYIVHTEKKPKLDKRTGLPVTENGTEVTLNYDVPGERSTLRQLGDIQKQRRIINAPGRAWVNAARNHKLAANG